jgi:hypothetical protein
MNRKHIHRKMENKNKTEQGNKPVRTYRGGLISLSVWSVESGDNKFNTFTLSRSYKKNEEWQKSSSFTTDDLPKIKMLIEQAYKDAILKI